MNALMTFFIMFAIAAIFILFGVGIGFVLSKMIPGMDIGLGIVAGAIFSFGIIDLWLRFFKGVRIAQDKEMHGENEDVIISYVPSKKRNSRKKKRK